MKRRIRLWGLVLVAIALYAWGIARYLDGRPNPILVKGGTGSFVQATFLSVEVDVSEPGAPVVEVEVARARPIRMKVIDELVHLPEGVTASIRHAEHDEVAAELRELRRALDAWLAVPGRGMKVQGTETWTEIRTGLFGINSQRGRVVLYARLVPATAAKK